MRNKQTWALRISPKCLTVLSYVVQFIKLRETISNTRTTEYKKARKIVVLLKAFDINKKMGFTVEAKLGQVLFTTQPWDRRITSLSEHGSGQSKLIIVISVRARGSNPGLESGELHLSYQLWLWYGNIRYY